jgi:hypothetical protein
VLGMARGVGEAFIPRCGRREARHVPGEPDQRSRAVGGVVE